MDQRREKAGNRHWDGRGKIMVDVRAVPELCVLIGEKALPRQVFEPVEIEDQFPITRIETFLNERKPPTS